MKGLLQLMVPPAIETRTVIAPVRNPNARFADAGVSRAAGPEAESALKLVHPKNKDLAMPRRRNDEA
jgi:hypothetical protein